MNVFDKITKILEAVDTWESDILKRHENVDKGQIVKIVKQGNIRKVYKMNGSHVATYNMNKPEEKALYQERYEKAL